MKWYVSGTTRWVAVLSAVMAAVACGGPEPIRVGFVAGLSGRVADLGVGGRNGAMLAVEQRNAAGGVQGRPVELIVRDDKQDPETAKQVVAGLIKQNVAAIIGPMTSSMALATVPLVNSSDIIMLSPTVTTTELTGKDDNFLRVISTTADSAAKAARYQAEKLGHRKAVVIYDLNNRAYTESWLREFRATFEAAGGKVIREKAFRSGKNTAFYDSVKELVEMKPDCFAVVTGAVDAAMIAHQVHKLHSSIPLVMAGWASTERLVELGGAAVEGAYVSQYLSRNDRSERYLAFRRAYRERFGQDPGYGSVTGYDAATVILDSLKARDPQESLKETILKTGTFQGVQQPITIDRYGEANRNLYIFVVRDGKYVNVE